MEYGSCSMHTEGSTNPSILDKCLSSPIQARIAHHSLGNWIPCWIYSWRDVLPTFNWHLPACHLNPLLYVLPCWSDSKQGFYFCVTSSLIINSLRNMCRKIGTFLIQFVLSNFAYNLFYCPGKYQLYFLKRQHLCANAHTECCQCKSTNLRYRTHYE